MQSFDVLVLGGGPAGSTVALVLARAGLSVLALDREAPTATCAIPVGEGLPPAVHPLLARLGLDLERDGHLPSYGNASAWGAADLQETHFLWNPYGHGWHLDRRRFDALLRRSAAAAGADVVSGVRVRECIREGGRWQLRADGPGGTLVVSAASLVDATGRASWLAGRQGARRLHHDRLVGCAGLLAPSGSVEDPDSQTLVEAAPEGWWYTAALPGGERIAVYMTDAGMPSLAQARDTAGWLALLGETRHVSARTLRQGFRLRCGPRLLAAGSSRLESAAGRGWIAVGDAAAAFDPLSSQGLLSALQGGCDAADSLVRHHTGDDTALESYAAGIDLLFRNYLDRRNQVYAQERRWPDSPFWRRRQAAAAAAL